MPKEIIGEHGIARRTNPANKIPKTLLADEEFKKFRTHGTAIKRQYAKQLKHTTLDQKNNIEATFDASHSNLIQSLSSIAITERHFWGLRSQSSHLSTN
jgi:hypothetical protein